MDFQPIINLVAQTGIWCVTAFVIGKVFFDYVKKDKEQEREDHKEERDRMYTLIENQGKIMEQQKELLGKQVLMSEHNKEMLDRLTDIQMLHTNRLDRIEDRQSRLEEEVKEINKNLQNKKGE